MDLHILGFGLVNCGLKVILLCNTVFDTTILQEPILLFIFCLYAIYYPGIMGQNFTPVPRLLKIKWTAF